MDEVIPFFCNQCQALNPPQCTHGIENWTFPDTERPLDDFQGLFDFTERPVDDFEGLFDFSDGPNLTTPSVGSGYHHGLAGTEQRQHASRPTSDEVTPHPVMPDQSFSVEDLPQSPRQPSQPESMSQILEDMREYPNGRWYCPIENCAHNVRGWAQRRGLVSHLSEKHGDIPEAFPCTEGSCAEGKGVAFKRYIQFTQHCKAYHNPDVPRFDCPFPGCNKRGLYNFGNEHSMNEHKVECEFRQP